MNYSAFNASALNSPANTAEDAVLAGGFYETTALNASVVIGAFLLSIGLSSYSVADANLHTVSELRNGVTTVDGTGASYVVDLVMQGGFIVDNAVGGNVGISITGGTYSTDSFASAQRLAAVLTGGAKSYCSVSDSGYTYSLIGGVYQNSTCFGRIAGVLSGGASTQDTLDAKYGIGLTGGAEQLNSLGSEPLRFSFVGEPAYSTDILSASLYIPITLYGGAYSNAVTSGDLTWKPGTYGGAYSDSIVHASLVADTSLYGGVMSVNPFDASYTISVDLEGGVTNRDSFNSVTHYDAVLLGGIALTDTLSSDNIKCGMTLNGGIALTDTLNAKRFYDCVLLGNVIKLNSVDAGMLIDAHLLGGSVTITSAGSNLVSSVELEGGTSGLSHADAVLRLDAVMVDDAGTSSNTTVGGKYRLSGVLSGGMSTTDSAGSAPLVASINIAGGFSTHDTCDAAQAISPVITGGANTQTAVFTAGYIIDSALNNGIHNTDIIAAYQTLTTVISGGFASTIGYADAALTIEPTIEGGVSQRDKADAYLLVSQYLLGGLARGNNFDAFVRVIPPVFLLGGVVTTDLASSDADISSYYGDMWHNTWQLEIASVTDLLEIETPTGDS